MMKRILFSILCYMLSLTASGQPTDSLEFYLHEVAMANPQLKADFATYKMALAKVDQVSVLNDPTLEMGFFLKPMELVGGRQYTNFKLMQMFPWFGTKAAQKREAVEMARVAFEKFRINRDRLLLQTRLLWYELVEIQVDKKLLTQQLAYLEQMNEMKVLRFTSAQISGNAMGSKVRMSDVLRLRLEMSRIRNKIEQMDSRLVTKKSAFNAMLRRPARMQLQLPDTLVKEHLPVRKSELAALVSTGNPLLMMTQAEQRVALANGQKVRKMGWPTLGIGLEYSLIGPTDVPMPVMKMSGMDMVMPMVSISIPLYRKKYSAMRRESLLQQQVAEWKRDDAERNLDAQVATVLTDLEQAERDLDFKAEQIRLANQTLELAMGEFTSQQNLLEDILEISNQLLTLRQEQITALRKYNEAVARIYNLISIQTK